MQGLLARCRPSIRSICTKVTRRLGRLFDPVIAEPDGGLSCCPPYCRRQLSGGESELLPSPCTSFLDLSAATNAPGLILTHMPSSYAVSYGFVCLNRRSYTAYCEITCIVQISDRALLSISDSGQDYKKQLKKLVVEAPRIYHSLPVLPSSDDTALQTKTVTRISCVLSTVKGRSPPMLMPCRSTVQWWY
jgi:hypothetical protein